MTEATSALYLALSDMGVNVTLWKFLSTNKASMQGSSKYAGKKRT